MLHYTVMFLGLALFWLFLSGHFIPLILFFGVCSCVFVVWLVHRMDVIDHEVQHYSMGFRTLSYIPWLVWEIVKSNIEITRIILDPKMPISPTIFTAPSSQKTEMARVIYANSITLTPGTVTIDIHDNGDFLIHALTRSGADSVLSGYMDRRVCQIEPANAGQVDQNERQGSAQ